MFALKIYFKNVTYTTETAMFKSGIWFLVRLPCRVGSVGSVSASRTVGREFTSRPGHTKDHHKKWYKLPPCMACNALG